MTFIWFIVWLLSHTPTIAFTGPHAWNSWTIALVICVLLDLMGTRASVS